ncbi:hypothetical protein [Haladaptatus sp. DYF46]|uniref:hypothetical protein n=1 Tax=Haladaptatus sp. DYF46 TaxID=2886041 RepID=UPI001E2FE455|nr:hypothetical protein [Haladaptatus sp. DYF46]
MAGPQNFEDNLGTWRGRTYLMAVRGTSDYFDPDDFSVNVYYKDAATESSIDIALLIHPMDILIWTAFFVIRKIRSPLIGTFGKPSITSRSTGPAMPNSLRRIGVDSPSAPKIS